MLRQSLALLAATVLALTGAHAFAQTPPPAATAAPVANAIAATVNGRPIYEAAVQRGLERVPPTKRAEGRGHILDFLIENELIEQYLLQLQVAVDPKEVDKMLEQAKADIKKAGKDWEVWLKSRQITEAELKQVFAADQRWNKYALSIGTDKVLRELFEANKDTFDGTQVHARHIFLAPNLNDPKACQAAAANLQTIKQQIEKTVADGLQQSKLAPDSPEWKRARCQLLEETFAAAAKKESSCPSKSEGGDLHYFPRVSDMVEPFSKAAFALKPFEMSDVVQTPFGYHLILVVDRTGTRDVKFEDVKNSVLEVYCDKKREEMVKDARQKSRIEIAPVAPSAVLQK